MFTGLVEEVGRLAGRWPSGRFRFTAERVLADTAVGDSIAVNGCCLTVVAMGEGYFEADLVSETLDRTTLGRLAEGTPVNLERSIRAGAFLGGHFVQGHVDGRARVLTGAPDLTVMLAPEMAPLVAAKGSIAIDGVSLTVAGLADQSEGTAVRVAIVPHTASATALAELQTGDEVNVEVDVIARYLARLASFDRASLDRASLDRASFAPQG
jgi:riboflavin synthase